MIRGFGPRQSIIIDGVPVIGSVTGTVKSQESTIRESHSLGVDGTGSPWRFALVEISGSPTALMSSVTHGAAENRIATPSALPVKMDGRAASFGKTRVTGPGQWIWICCLWPEFRDGHSVVR